ncbi:unnamed protein product [Cercospora beticola]|nr:unnamed protein product [Cercospora beticola]
MQTWSILAAALTLVPNGQIFDYHSFADRFWQVGVFAAGPVEMNGQANMAKRDNSPVPTCKSIGHPSKCRSEPGCGYKVCHFDLGATNKFDACYK